MKLSSAYVEMLTKGVNRPVDAGKRPYPAGALEIMLLCRAQAKAHRRECRLFRRLCVRFDWQLSPQRQQHYSRQLAQGHTLVLADPNSIIVWVSHSFMQMTGHRVAEMIGQKRVLLPDPATIRGSWAGTVQTERLDYRKDGTTYTRRVAVEPLRNSRGELTHFLAVEYEIS